MSLPQSQALLHFAPTCTETQAVMDIDLYCTPTSGCGICLQLIFTILRVRFVWWVKEQSAFDTTILMY